MYNTMSGVNVADNLGLGSEVRELKFGSSFTSGGRGQQQGSFHSVRYDFKPASVDASKMATLDVGQNGQVTISMPNVDGNGTTVFKGARKPYAKECVLIIDHDTGEVVLEKLTHNIQVKRTREEGGSKKPNALSMPAAPAPPPAELKKSQPSGSGSFKMESKLGGREREDLKKPMPPGPGSSSQIQHQLQPNTTKRGPNHSPKPPLPQLHQSPSGPSPGQITSPPMAFSPTPAAISSQEPLRQKPSHPMSLTNFEDLLSMPLMNPPATASAKPKVEKPLMKESGGVPAIIPQQKSGSSGKPSKDSIPHNNVSALSESSSGEDSSSSSSSDDDDDDSSDDMEDVPDKVPVPPAPESNKSPAVINSRPGRPPPPPAAPSMPTDLLCEDLQLSESGSDSE